MWLLVDKVKTGGSEKSVDGNMVWYIFTAIGLTPAGSSIEHIYTQTIHRTEHT